MGTDRTESSWSQSDPSTYRFVYYRRASAGCTVGTLTVVVPPKGGSVLHDLDGIIGAAESAVSDAGPITSFPPAAAA